MLDSTPTGWRTLSLAYLLSGSLFKDGDWIESKDQSPDGSVRLIQLADIGDGYFIDKSNRFLTHERAKKLKCTFLHRDDILVARMPDPIGRCCLFPLDGDEAYVTAVDVCILRAKGGINKKWLTNLINSPRVRSEIEQKATGTTRQRISRKNLGAIRLKVPPLPEQERIAEILTSVDDSIRATEAVIAQAERVKRGLMEDLLTGGLGSEAIARGEVPEGWQASTFEQLVISMNGGVSVNSQSTPAGPNEKGVLKTSAVSNGWFNINENKVVLNDEEIARLKEPVQAGTIIFSRMNTPQLVGANAFVSESNEDVFLPDRLWAIKPNTEEVVDEWLGFWMQHQFVSGAFQSLGTGTSGSMKNISKQKLNALKVAIPSQGEQSSTVNALRAINAQIEVNKQTVDQLQTIKRGLMDDLLTGRVRTV